MSKVHMTGVLLVGLAATVLYSQQPVEQTRVNINSCFITLVKLHRNPP